ncbi:MAG: FtsX-like permease family protein [Treponema sp.]|jgi:ABC-type lipoprotein release transport system permease subunit|nr:FtsX-like permease family protein [Treponema sp.]
MVFFLVLRNIARNKKNSAIIALLIAVITFLFFIGNSVIGKSNLGLRQAFVQSLTGDVVLEAKADVTMNLFGANTPIIDTFLTIPVLPAYGAVMEIIRAEEGIASNGIASATSQVSGKAYLDLLGVREPVLLCGIDADSYFSLFPGIILEEGRLLRSGEYGAMITAERAKRIEVQSGQYPVPGMSLLLTSGSAIGFKIREVPLVGIFSYTNPGQFMNEIVIIDPQTVRVLNSIQVASAQDTEIDESALSLLNANTDDIFSDFFAPEQNEIIVEGFSSAENFSADMLQAYLKETKTEETVGLSGGDWNFIILTLKRGTNVRSFISSLNKKLEPYGVIAVDWRIAAGTSAILLLLIQALFNMGIFLVCVAGVITVINILLIGVFRRTREIGTLRAIGASGIYIASLVLQENLVLTAFAGAAGIFGGALFIKWINSLSVIIPNELIASLLGGNVLSLGFIPHVAVLSFVLAVALGIVVSIYPVYVTVRVEPMSAVRHG